MLYDGCDDIVEDKLIYLEHPIPAALVPAQAAQQVAKEAFAAHTAWVKGSKENFKLMLMTMESDIQQNLENLGAYEMLQELKTLFAQQAKRELLQTMREFHFCKQEEGQSVSSYILKLKSYIENLEHLGHPMSLVLGTINELHAMLHEQTLPKNNAPALYAIRAAELLKNKKLSQGASGSGIFTIEINVLEYQILTRKIAPALKPKEEIIQENVFSGGNRDHVLPCLCYMLYCVLHSEKFILAYYMAKRMEWVTRQKRLLLPYGMLLTHLFKVVMNENHELYNESYVLYDRVMNPLAAQQERKPKKDRGTRRGRHFTSSSSAFDQPSSSYLNDDDDDDDENSEGTSRASIPSPFVM
nr:zinc finger, CCHC-type [Tanacetum cinerariifolium]